jgi:hypothetical protein
MEGVAPLPHLSSPQPREQQKETTMTTFKHPTIHAALVAAQSEIGSAIKGAANPFFKSTYADLGSVIEAVKEPLNKHGLAVTQELNVIETITGPVNTLCTTLIHESGETLESSVLVPVIADIQKFGAAITYLRRYALQSFMLVPAADDDGESLQDRKPEPPKYASKFKK